MKSSSRYIGLGLLFVLLAAFPLVAPLLGLDFYIGFVRRVLVVALCALLVSALAYVLFALNELFRQFGAVELNVALTALVIGSALLMLSAFWHQARRVVVTKLPATLQERLPNLDRPAFVATQPAA